MKKVDSLWFILISEMFVNLAAGWIGVGLAVIFATDKEIFVKLGLLTVNLVAGIVSMVVAFKLRKKGKK